MSERAIPKYPDIRVRLTGEDGNAFNILGLVNKALKRANVPLEERTQFMEDATSGDYDHLLAVCNQWVEVM